MRLHYVRDDAIRWETSVFTVLNHYNLEPTKDDDRAKFSGLFSMVVHRDVETCFYESIMARLYFPEISSRYENIPAVYADTLQWMLDNNAQQLILSGWDMLTGCLMQKGRTSSGFRRNRALEKVL